MTLLASLIYLGVLPWAIVSGSYDLWGGLLIVPILVIVSIPVVRRMARNDGDPWVMQLFGAALMVKLLGALVRYFVTFNVLGPADANAYHRAGAQIASEFRAFEFSGPYFQEHIPEFVGTPFIRLITGVFYTFTGPTKLGGFILFSWLGFWGLCLCYRAFRTAVPNGNHRLYAVFLFFMPSLVFWPSSIGKEAWMQLTIGICAYAVALILTHKRAGFVLLIVGVAASAAVRPHIALIVFFSLCMAYLIRPSSSLADRTGMLTKLVGIVILVVIGGVLVGRTQSFFEVEGQGSGAVDQVLTQVEEQTGEADSEFDNPRSSSPVQFPAAAVTVLFRPFPFEAGSAVALIASLEGLVLLVLLVRSVPRWRLVPRIPYAVFAATYTVLFIFAFSALSNFGILVRQRTQLLPLVLVIAALPALPSRMRVADEAIQITHGRRSSRPQPPGPNPISLD